MFEYIKGILAYSSPVFVAVDVHGLGYRLHIPLSHYAKLPPVGSPVQFFVSTVIREDAHKLFGFLSQPERDLFEHLIEISGIGPKTALALIGHMEFHELQAAIAHNDIAKVCKIPGIGKKTAERLIVEMRDKILKLFGEKPSDLKETGTVPDAVSALVHLGYNQAQAQKAIKAALGSLGEKTELALLITAALRYI
jgi:holliday junction DNA helicase RuvA